MALYQASVLKTYLKQQDAAIVGKAYKKYTKYFLNPTIQENIRNSKEEQFQATFLTELFVNILSYTLNPNPSFDLTTEFKNQKNARKADGAILKGKEAIGVIELKGTNTKDLESIRRQAFDYKANQKGCVYVITSNFEKLRFYINDATEFEEFNLFELTEDRFQLLYLCLQKDSVLTNVPLSIKEASIVEEEKITKSFYRDYSLFKRELYRDLVKQNGTRLKTESREVLKEVATDEVVKSELEGIEKNVKLSLFKKSQKLIDRFLFIFFAEDRGLLPPNSTVQILNKWKADVDFGDERPLYNLFKQYFNFLDTGRKGTGSRAEIYAYNGGLFKPDRILDGLVIDNDLLHKHALQLANYDFESQVDVNILGHIFENSLNEIESVNAEIEGGDFDKQKSKRKKDGVFYTPKYITKYIVENTVGKLCEEKKIELGFQEEEYFKGRTNRPKKKITELIQLLDDYRAWLLQITICDPACGSGAFLNQALDFLIKEHTYIDELKAKILGGGIVFSDIENTILENNIYGVDLNEESVEIAKLSLWLRTAQPRRKLNDLSSNIKCGNSLIDSKAVAGDKAFHWETAFAKVFSKGGFDVVIGNPPYVNMSEFTKTIHNYFETKYKAIHTGYNDLMYYFLYKGIEILKKGGIFGVITSNYFIGNDYAKGIRKFLSNHLTLVVNFEKYQVFIDANVHTAILIAEKNPTAKNVVFETYKSLNPITEISNNIDGFRLAKIDRSQLSDTWIIADKSKLKLINKLSIGNDLLGNISEIAKGSESGKNEVFTVNEETINNFSIESTVLKRCVKNSDINGYSISATYQYLIYSDNEFSKELYPNAFQYLEKNKELLLDRRGPKTGEYKWWRLHRPSIKEIFESNEKILVPYRAEKNKFSYDNQQLFNNGGDIRAIKIINDEYDTKFITSILNSTLINWYYGFIGKPKGNSREYFNKPLSQIPIKKCQKDIQVVLSDLANVIIEAKQIQEKLFIKFQKYLQVQFLLNKLPRKLQNWHKFDFGEFIKELNKAIRTTNKERLKEDKEAIPTLTKKDEFEWLELFEENKKKAQDLQTQINQTEKEIDAMVYELYGLTQDEIDIVENS